LSDIEELIIELDDNYSFELIEEKNDRKILVCGGTASFGMGCTVVSLMFSNILARKLNANVKNISLDDENYLKRINVEKLYDKEEHYDIGILELNGITKYESTNNLKDIINKMNSCCDITLGWFFDNEIEKIKEMLKYEINNELIIIKDISYMFNEENKEIYTYNNNIINDSGNIVIFKELFSTIREVSKWNI
jgi:hypothetical protein